MDLQYHGGVNEVRNKRNIKMLVSPWLITCDAYRILFSKFREQNSSFVSMGTFIFLRPFYVRAPNSKDIEMCVCKVHLHVRWAIEALPKLSKMQHIRISFKNCETFFNAIYSSNCVPPEGSAEYIKWRCTPSQDIEKNFATLNQIMK